MAVTAYTTVRSGVLTDLVRQVTDLIADDYVPFGGLVYDGEGYVQVMVIESA